MFAVAAGEPNAEDPIAALSLGDQPDPEVPDGWVTVDVKAASLNMHDVFTLRGVGLKEDAYPMILGCDGAGVLEDGTEVVLHGVVASPGLGGRRDARPQAHAAQREAPGHDGREGGGARAQRAAQARRAVVRRGRLPGHGVADRLPDAVREVRACGPARRCWSRARPAVCPPRWSAWARRRASGCGPPGAPRRSARWPPSSAPTRPSSPARGCPSGWTRCSRPWAPPPGRTRSSA